MTSTVLCAGPVGQNIFEMAVHLNVQLFIALVVAVHELRFVHADSVFEDLRDGAPRWAFTDSSVFPDAMLAHVSCFRA